MPTTPHIERRFAATATVRDVVIGMSDDLTAPFGLVAGLSAASSIAMGLGGYLAAHTDAEHHAAKQVREQQEIVDVPQREEGEVAQVFREFGLADDQIDPADRLAQGCEVTEGRA